MGMLPGFTNRPIAESLRRRISRIASQVLLYNHQPPGPLRGRCEPPHRRVQSRGRLAKRSKPRRRRSGEVGGHEFMTVRLAHHLGKPGELPARRWTDRPRLALVVSFLCALTLLMAFPGRSPAHPIDLSRLQVLLTPDGTQVTLSLNPQDLAAIATGGGAASSAPAMASWAQQRGPEWVRLQVGGTPLVARSAVGRASDDGSIVISVSYPAVSLAARSLEIRSNLLAVLPPGHQQLLSVRDARRARAARVLAEVTLDRQQFTWPVELSAVHGSPAEAPGSAVSFFRLCAAGAFTGYAPLLCLVALLLASDRPRTVGKLAALFVVACSIGIALAHFDFIRLPSRVLAEAAAASVDYVAAENLLVWLSRPRRSRPHGRMLLTPAFGLVQGLYLSVGFAAALTGAGLATDEPGTATALAWFVLGVVMTLFGATTLVFLMLLLAWRSPQLRKAHLAALSAAILFAGCWHLAESLGLLAR